MKRTLFYLFVVILGITSLQAQNHKPKFQQRGEKVIGFNRLSLGYAPENQGGTQYYPLNLQFQLGRFYKDKKMRGLRVGYGQALSPAAVFPPLEAQTVSVYAFRRAYSGTGRFSLYSEMGLGAERNMVNSLGNLPDRENIRWDAYVETRLGVSARIGKHLGFELNGGVQLGTDNQLANEQFAVKAGWITGWGINYFFK